MDILGGTGAKSKGTEAIFFNEGKALRPNVVLETPNPVISLPQYIIAEYHTEKNPLFISVDFSAVTNKSCARFL